MGIHRVVVHGLLFGLLVLGPSAVRAEDEARVKVCHRPPEQPGTLHSITVAEGTLRAHLAHGDHPGECADRRIRSGRARRGAGADGCDPSCDDGDPCTIDNCEILCTSVECTDFVYICLADHPPVDCDDSDLCTRDFCDPALGCLNNPIPCDDDDACTVDTCDGGQCFNPDITCPDGETCDPATGECSDPCEDVACTPIDDCHEAGTCVVVGGLPECVDGPTLPDGTACDDGDDNTIDDVCFAGDCLGALASCPCWNGDLRIPEDLGILGGLSLILDPEPLCELEPPPPADWEVVCRGTLTYATYVHPEICPEFGAYDSLIQLSYLISDGDMGRQCEVAITDAGYYSMFLLRSRVDNLSEIEFQDCQALLRQVFDCP